MDFYSTPANNTFRYNLATWFDLPLSDSGHTEKAVAVSKNASQYWIAAYSIIITLAFTALNKIATLTVATWFNLGGHGNRHIIFVTYFNSSSPTTAAYRMFQYMKRALLKSKRRGKWAINWDALFASFFLFSLAAAVIIANLATVLLVGGNKLVLRTAARANPEAIFYPENSADVQGTQLNQFGSWREQRSAAAFQAVGNVKSSAKKLKDNGIVKTRARPSTSDKGPGLIFEYEYLLSGADFGLQQAADLRYAVKGRCRTAYEWNIADNPKRPNHDAYLPWGNKSRANYVNRNEGSYSGPWANLFPRHKFFNRDKKLRKSGSYEFGIIPNTVGRYSMDMNKVDPWYSTGDRFNKSKTEYVYPVKSRRPGVACVQNDTWAYRGQTVKYATDLYKIPGLKGRLSNFTREKVFQREFASPPIINVASNLAYSVLESGRTFSPNTKTFLASSASLARDLEYLIYISYAYSREVVRNTATFNPNFNTVDATNAAAVNGTVPKESADFILESQDVAALSVEVLLTVPLLCIFLWLLVWLHSRVVKPQRHLNNTGHLARYSLRSVGFLAQNLYFIHDEQICGEMKWSGRVSDAPYIQDIDKDCPEESLKDVETGERVPVAVGRPHGGGGEGAQDRTLRVSSFAKPKLVPINESETGENTRGEPSGLTKCLPCARVKPTEKYALVMTDRWRRTGKLGRENGTYVKWAEIRHNLEPAKGRWSPTPKDKGGQSPG